MTTPLMSFWALRWGIPPEALVDLQRTLGALCPTVPAPPAANDSKHNSESAIQSLVRLEAARKGLLLWRNNVGVFDDAEQGIHVRFGLANDSKQVNKVLKSADLIGIRPITIGQQHVGLVIGQFVSREVKRRDWRWSGDDREVAQANWATLVASLGGDAQIVNSEGSL